MKASPQAATMATADTLRATVKAGSGSTINTYETLVVSSPIRVCLRGTHTVIAVSAFILFACRLTESVRPFMHCFKFITYYC